MITEGTNIRVEEGEMEGKTLLNQRVGGTRARRKGTRGGRKRGSHKVWSREFHIPLLLTPLTRRKLEGECEDLKLESLPRSSGYPVAIYALARNLQVFKSCLVQERRVVSRC